MTRRAPPRLASWLLQRFAFGPRRESLIGDIFEEYEHGCSAMWFLVEVITTVFVASATTIRTHPRPVFRASVLAVTVPVFFATAGSLLVGDIRTQNWLTVLFDVSVFGYCSMGLIVLMLTITCLDEPVSMSLLEPHTGLTDAD